MLLYYDIKPSGASAANAEFHHFSIFKTQFFSLWPRIPAIFDDIDTWPAEKFPDWLWLVDKPSEELSPKDGKKYWRKINREKIKKNNEIMKSKF